MTRFVELPTVSERGSTVWINPDHVVAVEAHYTEGTCWLMTEMGGRTHIALSQGATVECLDDYWAEHPDGEVLDLRPNDGPALRDSVRENLNR